MGKHRRVNDDTLDALAELMGEEFGLPPVQADFTELNVNFRPRLNPTQEIIYDSQCRYMLAHGERGSGKTHGAINKLVHHCFHNRNALAVIITGVRRQQEEGGAWHKLNVDVLPEWKIGAGLIYSEPKSNFSKDVIVWVSNKFGGWSRILMLSMPVQSSVKDRFKGPEPSFILVDEAQTLESDTYFKTLVQQIGRRKGIALQQIIYCANPAGPSHWLYKRFFINPINEKTGKMDPRYGVWHVPKKENRYLEKGYDENVLEAVRGDDIEYRRMVLGEWVDTPTEGAIFDGDFVPSRHVLGNAARNEGILPVKGYDFILGWDLGTAHSCISMMQCVLTRIHEVWIQFDEFVNVDAYLPYYKLVPKLIERMIMWEKKMETEFKYVHVSDDSAFNQFRAKDGSFDHLDIEKISKDYVKRNNLPERFIIRLIECPKGPMSLQTRVRSTKERLQQDSMLISATCTKTVESLRCLEQDKDERMKPKRSRFLHPWDALTYPQHYYNSRAIRPTGEKKPEPQVYSATA